MDAQIVVEKKTHLILSEKERDWLHAYMQNYQGSGEESHECAQMRASFFHATQPKGS